MEDSAVTNRRDSDIETLQKYWEGKITDINDDSIDQVAKAICDSYTLHFQYGGLDVKQFLSYLSQILSYMADNGIIAVMCDFLVYVMEGKCNSTQLQKESIVSIGAKKALGFFINLTEELTEQSHIIRNHPVYLSVTKTQLQRWIQLIYDKTASDLELTMARKSMDVIFNMTKDRDHVDKINELGFKDTLVLYFNLVEEPDLRLTSLAAVANLVDEKQSEILRTDNEILKFLIKSLGQAIEDKNHRKFGWTAEELVKVARRIGKNDSNKRDLVELGILQHLVPLAEKGEITEQIEAVKTMKTLSFDDRNRKTMVEDTSIVDIIVQLNKTSEDKKVRNTCERILWTMRENLAQSERYQQLGRDLQRSKKLKPTVPGATTGHVMISYQWNNQDLMKKVKNEIKKQNLTVWMDIDNMEGSILDAMAAAVENAAVVLMCVSRRYKDSDNCRDEAHYAHKLKKPIIPLMMEKRYRGDGWLGFIVGTRLYFSFSNPDNFDSVMQDLIMEIRRKLQRDEWDEPDAKLVTVPPATKVLKEHEIEEIKSWTTEKMTSWVEKHGLPKRKFRKLTGKDIAFLIILKQEVTGDFFYKTLMDLLKVRDLPLLSKLRFAFDDLS